MNGMHNLIKNIKKVLKKDRELEENYLRKTNALLMFEILSVNSVSQTFKTANFENESKIFMT